ncbi:MAG TPA: ribose-5-phosphate isomerase RpiA [bacterium]|nr:ribose-5-phosphate isomerase RpiA [bacterium]
MRPAGPRGPLEQYKREAAVAAVAAEVRDGMVVGLGTGSTAAYAVRELGRRVREDGWRIEGVPTSERTAALARECGVPLVTLDATPDVVLDGADQVDPSLAIIKGGGGAHAREKIVATAARRSVIVADHTKAVTRLHGPVPLEVLPFAVPWILRTAAARVPGAEARPRLSDGRPVVTDNGNVVVELVCGPIDDPAALATELDGVPGIVEHGLFVGVADVVYLAGPEGLIKNFAKPR